MQSRMILAKVHRKVGNDRQIQDENDSLRESRPSDDFISLQRNKGPRDDNRKVFGPALPEQQAEAFGEMQARIEESAHAQFLQRFFIQYRKPRQ